MTALGFVVASGQLYWDAFLPYMAFGSLGALELPITVHLFLAFPSGRLETSLERRLVAGGYCAWLVVVPLGLLLGDPRGDDCPQCPANPFRVVGSNAVLDAIDAVVSILVVGVFVVTAILLVRKVRAARGATRRALGPVLLTSAFAILLFVPYFIVDATGGQVDDPPLSWAGGAFMLIPIAFLVGLLRTRLQRSGVADLVVELGSLSRPRRRPRRDRPRARRPLARARLLALRGRALRRSPREPARPDRSRRARRHRARARREARRRARPRPVAPGRARARRGRRRRREPRARERAPAGRSARPARGGARLPSAYRRGRRRRAAAARARPPRRRPAATARDPTRAPARPRTARTTSARSTSSSPRPTPRSSERSTSCATLARGIHPRDPHRRGSRPRPRGPGAARARPGRARRPRRAPARARGGDGLLRRRARHSPTSAKHAHASRGDDRRSAVPTAAFRSRSPTTASAAPTSTGPGLRGLRDRVEALDGRLAVESPVRGGTRVTAAIPCG